MTKLIKDNHDFDNEIRSRIYFEEQEMKIEAAPRNKGMMMSRVYTKEELRHIDAGLPKAYWDGKDKSIQIDTAIHVVNYNEPNRMGKLENMEEVARERNIYWEGL